MLRWVVISIAVVTVAMEAQARKLTMGLETTEVQCPSGDTCDGGQTCCQNPQGDYACCKLENAVCCSDGQHCCPNGYTCDVGSGSCISPHSNAMKMALPAVPKTLPTTSTTPASSAGIVCPGGTSCPNAGAACCRTYSGTHNCCNYPYNVCCEDGLHCCHAGYVCNQLTLQCIPYPSTADQGSPMVALLKPAEAEVYEAEVYEP